MALTTKYPLDYRPNGDTIDDFARKYMQEIDAIYNVLNAIIGHGVVPDMEIVAGQIKVEHGKLYVRNANNTEWKLFGDSEKNLNEVVAVINPETGTIDIPTTGNAGKIAGIFIETVDVQDGEVLAYHAATNTWRNEAKSSTGVGKSLYCMLNGEIVFDYNGGSTETFYLPASVMADEFPANMSKYGAWIKPVR